MTPEEFNYIKDSFSQIIDDIAGNPDWQDAAKALTSDLGTLERELKKKVLSLPSNLNKAAEKGAYKYCVDNKIGVSCGAAVYDAYEAGHKAGAEWMQSKEEIIRRNPKKERI